MLRRLLPKQYDFFELFNRHAKLGREAVCLMDEAMRNLDNNADKIRRIEDLEHNCDSITHQTVDLLRKTFITPIDHDEILRLISRMDDFVDYVDAAAHRLELFEIKMIPPELIQLCEVLIQTHAKVTDLVALLPRMKNTEQFRVYCMEINSLENEGDRLHRMGIAALFHKFHNDPLMVIKLKEIYEILENAIDTCEDVSNIVESIVLEHT